MFLHRKPDFDYVADPEPEGGMPPAPIDPDDEGHKKDTSAKPARKSR